MKVLLGIIIFLAFAIRIYNLNYNTPFVDEAMYITVGSKILEGDLASGIGASSWVGGVPFIYPLLTALFYEIGGIVGSRFFTAILGTFCVFLMYYFTRQLMFFRDNKINETAGLLAAAFTAVTTIAITTSRLAIYDGLAFTLFFLGIVLFHRALYTGEKKFYISSAIILFLSFLAKYIVIIFFPFLLLVPLLVALQLHKRESIRGIIFNFWLPLLSLTGLYLGLNFTNLQEFFVNQGVVSKATEIEVTNLFWAYTGFSYILVFLGLPLLWKRDEHLLLLLVLFSLIPLMVHTLTGNSASIQQHTFLSLIFILPLVGAILAYLITRYRKVGIIIAVLILGLQVFITIPQMQEAEGFWPDLTEGVKVIEPNLESSDRILAESGDSLYLLLKDKITQDQITGPFVFSYDGKEGITAYAEAIKNGYFQFIQLEGTYFSETDIQVILSSIDLKYRKTFDDGSIKIFELNQ